MAIETSRRPIGFWLKAVDQLITQRLDAALSGHGIDREDWRRLNAIGRGTGGRHSAGELLDDARLSPLVFRGWVELTEGTWALTSAGRQAYDELLQEVDETRRLVSTAVSEDDFATMMRSLQAIAVALGFDESDAGPV